MKKSFKYILFDWDGCLVDSLQLWITSIQKGFTHNNLSISLKGVVENRLLNEWERLKEMGIDNIAQFGDVVYKHYNSHLYTLKLHEQVTETLQSLKDSRLKTAIITSSYKRTFLNSLNHQNCTQYFDTLITRDDVTHSKPHREPLEKALSQLKGTKEEALIIGDSYADILAGKNADITTVWYYPKKNEQFYEATSISKLQPNYTIRDMKELLNIVHQPTLH